MPRFPSATKQLATSITRLAELTTTLAIESAIDAGRCDVDGDPAGVVEQVSRLAVGIGVATGELSRLVAELRAAPAREDELAEAATALAGLQFTLTSLAGAVQAFAEDGGPVETDEAAAELRVLAGELGQLLPAAQPCML